MLKNCKYLVQVLRGVTDYFHGNRCKTECPPDNRGDTCCNTSIQRIISYFTTIVWKKISVFNMSESLLCENNELVLQKVPWVLCTPYQDSFNPSSQNHSFLKLSLIESHIRWDTHAFKLQNYKTFEPIFVFQSTDGKVFKTFPLSSVWGPTGRPVFPFWAATQ